MSDKKPQVLPQSLIDQANQTGVEIAQQLESENQIIGEVSVTEEVAAELMRKRTEEQIAARNAALREQEERIAKFEAERNKMMDTAAKPPVPPTPPTPPTPPAPPKLPNFEAEPEPTPEPEDKYASVNQPQYNASYDVIPLPSQGKVYKGKKKAIKVAYMTAADEDILTNPNLMSSGDFLEILFDRKILEPNLRYKDLHVGDRNAIMIWLRATGYGSDYPITAVDPATGDQFEYIVDLGQIQTKELEVETDKDGYFDYTLPVSGVPIKFKFLTIGDVDDIEKHTIEAIESGRIENYKIVTYTLEKHIVEVNGVKDKGYIKDFIQTMRVGDSDRLRAYIDEIESGIDMRLEIRTPGDGSISTFLPLNTKFFWPNL